MENPSMSSIYVHLPFVDIYLKRESLLEERVEVVELDFGGKRRFLGR